MVVGCVLTIYVEYLAGVANESPIFSPSYTPVYSNEAFAILGLVLQSMRDTPTDALFKDILVKPLGLKSTFFELPSDITSRGVIPQSPEAAGWSTTFGAFSPYSSPSIGVVLC